MYWVGQKVRLVLSKNKRHIFHFHQELYLAMYSLTEQTFWPAQYLHYVYLVGEESEAE